MPLDSPEEGSQDEVQEGAAASEEGDASNEGGSRRRERSVSPFDSGTLKALLRVYSSENPQKERGMTKDVSSVLSLSEKDITKAITAKMRTLREEVQYLLGAYRGESTGDLEAVRQGLEDDAAPASLQQISAWRETLVTLFHEQGQDAETMMKEHFKGRVESRQYQEQARVLQSVEVVFLLSDIAGNRRAKVQEALETPVQTTNQLNAIVEVRNRLFALLSTRMQQGFDPMKKFDVLLQEIWQERQEQEYNELSGKILKLFGRGKGEAPFHTSVSLAKALCVEEGRIEHILGQMNQKGKIAFMKGAGGQGVSMCRDKKAFQYLSDELLAELDPSYFDQVGAFLKKALDEGKVVDREYLKENEHDLELPPDVAAYILDCYVDVKRLRRTKDKGYQMPQEEEKTLLLSSTVFERISLAQQFYELAAALNDEQLDNVSEAVSWETIERDYKKFWERRSVDEIPLKTKRPSLKIYPFMEIQFGHKDLDREALQRRVEELKALPVDERPDQIVVSGILFGRFKHWSKDKHKMRVYQTNQQLHHAKFFLDQLRPLGIPIIYNMSDDDALIVKEYTYDAVELIESLLQGGDVVDRSTKRHLARGAAYWQFEQAQRSKAWPQHYAFQWDVGMPYMLGCGRHLYTAEEVQERFGVEPIEEYLLLLYAYKKRKDGESLEQLVEGGDKLATLALKVLEMENIPFYGEEQKGKIIVANDFILNVETQGRTRTVEEKHSWKQSGVSMVRDPMKAARAIYDQYIADGEKVPDLVVGENEQHTVGVLRRHNDGHILVATTPGLQTFNRKSSSYARHSSDKSERMAFGGRGERFIAGTTSFEITDDDRYKIEFFNDKFMDIAAKTKERMLVVTISDLQLGSVTADFDTAIKCLDYVLYQLLADPKAKAVIFINGDMGQYWNYPLFPIENARMGLVGAGRQQKLLVRVFENILNTLPREIKSRIEIFDITDGNHEWNSPGKRAEIGLSHSLPIEMAIRHASEGLYKTNLCDFDVPVVTKDGSRFISTTAFEKVQEYGFLVQHIHQIKGGKGSGGGPPVYLAKGLIEGVAPHMPDAHVLIGGHYHEPNYFMYDNKLAIVNGSWARISGYEWWLGYCPTMGTVVMHVGGGKPPVMEVITAETLYKYKMKGYYKDEPGCETDQGHDPRQHTFAGMLMGDGKNPMSGVQKKLIKDMDELKKERPLHM